MKSDATEPQLPSAGPVQSDEAELTEAMRVEIREMSVEVAAMGAVIRSITADIREYIAERDSAA